MSPPAPTPLPETLALLRRVVEADPTEEALAYLEREATHAGDWPHVILARRKLAETATDGLTRAALLWELGCAHMAAGDLAGADADFARAIEAEAGFIPALRALARLREARGDARAAAELYAREARLTKAAGRAADAFRQAARLYANQVRDDAMAGRCLEEVLALEPEAETDFEVLEVILRARSEEERLGQVMRRRAAAGTLPKRRDRLLALAELTYARDPIRGGHRPLRGGRARRQLGPGADPAGRGRDGARALGRGDRDVPPGDRGVVGFRRW